MRKIYTLLFLLFVLGNGLKAQTDYVIGTGTTGNLPNSTGAAGYPCPMQDYYESSRAQYLWRASELIGAGMSAGFINAIKWEVASLGTAGLIESYQVKIGTTSATTLSASAWETLSASAIVFATADYQPVAGTNTFTLSTPFFWNGVDNLIVEVCNGDPGNATGNWYTVSPVVNFTTGLSFNASHTYRADNAGNACGTDVTTNTGTQTTRPNTTFNFTPAPACNGTPIAGTTTSTSINVCNGVPFSLGLTGTSPVTGLSYLWQYSTTGSAPWTDIPTATSWSITGQTQTVTTWYRAAVSCGANTDYSAPIQVVTPVLLNGTYTIDNTLPASASNFPSFAAAALALQCGVGGPVIFNVTAGQIFNETEDLNFLGTGTATNTITFQKNGAGANPVVRRAGTSATTDYIIRLTGVSYYTFNGIDFQQTGTSAADYVENGIHIINSTATAGAKFNTFKNGKVTIGNYGVAKCVYVQASPTPTDFTGTNSNNRFLNMATEGGLYGYHFAGATTTYKADGNEVGTESGGVSTVQGIANGPTSVILYGIYGEYQTNFKVRNTTVNGITGSGTNTIYGITAQTSASNTVEFSNNTVTAMSGGGTVYAVYVTAGETATIANNEVYNITTSGNAGAVRGIYVTATGITANITGNRIYAIRSTGTTTTVAAGIELATGLTFNVYNNMISDITAPASTQTAAGTRGITVTGGSTGGVVKLYHNTIFLNDVSTVATYTSAALHNSSTTPTLDIRNNIFVNTSNVSTGTRVAAFWKTATTDNIDNASNNNLYYSGVPSPKNLVYYNGTASVETLADYKTQAAVAPGESASISVLPAFVNSTTAPYDLHIQTTVPTEIESGGAPIAAVTTDIDGGVRSTTAPDIGADEFAGLSADLTGPSVAYTALPVKTICAGGQTISATITDGSGVDVAAGTKPRLWFKKASDNNVLAATNTSASNGWKWVEASNSSSPFTFAFDYSLLTSPLVAGDSLSYFIVAQDLAGIPNIGVNAATFTAPSASVALSTGAFPVSGSINGFLVLIQPNPISVKADKTELCASGTVTLDIDGIDIPGGELQWQSSPAGANTWSDIAGATTVPYTTATLTASTDFRLVLKCSGTPISLSPSPVVNVLVNNPQITASTGATRCGPGTVTLQASATGLDVNWYTTATGGASIFNGDVFTTPNLNSTTTFYAGASSGATIATVGPLSPAIGTQSASNIAIGTQGGFFDVLAPSVTITSVDVYPSAAVGSSFSIEIRNSAGTTIFTSQTFVTTVTGGTTPQTVVLNATIPAGTGYKIGQGTAINLMRNTTGAVYPYTLPGIISLTGNTFDPVYFYFFYNWQIQIGCEGTRVPVTATIVSPPAITKNATPAIICEGQSSTLTAGSTNAGYTYSWQPVGQPGASITVSPAATTRYYVTAVDNSGGTFNGCTNLDSVDVTVSPVPSPITITPPPPVAVCATGPAVALGVEGGTVAFTGDIGTGTIQNANNVTTNMPPYGNYYSGNRHQMLVLASELTAQGFTTGSIISSLAFDVVSNSSVLGYNNFTIRIGHTTAAALTTTFLTSTTTQVFNASGFVPVAGWNVHDFSTPFVWDGTSNLLVETSFTNCGMGASTCTTGNTCTGTGSGVTWSTSAITNQSNTPFVSHAYYYSDGESCNPQTIATASTSVSVRPNMRFGFGAPTTVTWSPITGLYTDAAGITAYTAGTNARTVYARPTVATTYTATAATAGGACSSTGTVNVAVTTPPSATIAYSGSPYCNTGTATVTQTGSTGGTYTSLPGLSINASTGAIDLAASTPGTYLVTYTVAAAGGCASYSTTASVTVNAAPSATISYFGSPFCIGASSAIVTLTGTTGGTFSSTPGLAIDPATGAVDIAASTQGSYTVTYTVAASGGCPVYTATTNFTITTTPAATISYASAPYCTNAGTATVTRNGSGGGEFSSTTGLSIDAATGDINLGASTAGTYTVTYAIAAGSGCSAFSTTTSITINAGPSATITYAGSPYCSGAGIATVTHTGTAGGSYTSTSGLIINQATGEIDLGNSTPGTYTVTYTVAPSNGCVEYTTTTSVTISVRPNAIISYAGSPFCNTGTTVNVTRVGTAGGTYSSTAGLTIDAATGQINIATSTVGTYTVTYTIPAANGCPVFTATATVGIAPPPTATISYAGSPFCTNGGTTAVTLTGTIGGQFTSTNGLAINPNTGVITLAASVAGTYTVTYTVPGPTGCSAFSTTASVTVTTAPTAQISYPGSPFCSNGTTANVTRTGNIGGTYSSTTGLSINASTGQINIATSTPGSYVVSYTVTGGGGCSDLVVTTPVTITQAPGATISYAGSPYCSGSGTATVTHTGTTGGSYSSTNGIVINQGTGEIDLAASVPGTYVVNYVVAASNGCAIYSASTGVTITARPTATISYAGSPYCGNGSIANVTRTGTAGGTYTSTTGLSINATTGAITLGTSTPGTYTVTYTLAAAGACPGFTTTADVTITPGPTATISYGGTPYCGSAGTASVTHTGTTGGIYSSTTGLSIDATTGAITLGTSTPGTYTVTYSIPENGGCQLYTATASVTVTPAPVATISYAGSPYCGSTGTAGVTLTGTLGGIYSSSAGLSINAATGAVNIGASTPGSYTVNYTLPGANGCPAYTATATLLLTTPGTWTGIVSTDWNNPSNWCGGMPSSATDAIIPSSAPNMPVISNGSASVRNISTGTATSVTVAGGGTLEIYGDFSGGGTLDAANGSINLRGSANQSLPAFTVANLAMNQSGAASSLVLGGNSVVTGSLTLANGNITLGANNLSLAASSNGKLASHIITNGTGSVIANNLAASQNRTIPVGSDAVSYNPVALIANAGHTADNFSVRVIPGVFENGTSGTTLTTHVVDRTWIINEGTQGGSNINVTLQWMGSQELPSFNRTKSYVTQYGTNWAVDAANIATGSDPFSQIKTGITTLGSFSVQTEPIPRPVTSIYPNPVAGFMYVVTDLLSTGPVVFSIYDDKGSLVYRKREALTVGLNQTRLDIPHLAAGVYLLKVSTRLNEQFIVQRFLKTN